MSIHQCVGPLGRAQDGVPSGCPTTPRYRLQLNEIEIWACERHLATAVKAFETQEPVAVARAA